MAMIEARSKSAGKLALKVIGIGTVAAAAAFGWMTLTASRASAYIGESFLSAPGLVQASGSVGPYQNWLRITAHYWAQADTGGIFGGNRNRLRRNRMFFSGPPAPQKGPDKLIISVDKRSRALPLLMARCAAKATLPELSFAEDSMRSRGLAENGPRPASFPAYYEYRLKTVTFSDCPVVAGAPEQAIVLSFQDIQWLNYSGPPEGADNPLTPAAFMPISATGKTKTFVLSWFAIANDAAEGQCPAVNKKPTEADYYALVPAAVAASEKLERAKEGGINYENGQMARRGPDKINACLLPGIIPDPGHIYPVSQVARGLDLDGDNGTGKPPAGVCRHKNYRSDDGRGGIDNQLFTVQGCMPGYQGHKGFLMQYRNEQRRNGLLSMLVQITGIDNDQNDDSVEVAILYSKDPMAKNAAGSAMLPDFTFRLTDQNEFTHYFTRLRGKIVNGVIETERTPQLQFHPGIDSEVTLYQAGMRFKIQPDGSIKGVAAGYEDWRRVMAMNANSNSESLYGFQCPALYGALKRNADGLKNPVTGECDGISSAYDLEGVAAFIPPAQLKSQMARN